MTKRGAENTKLSFPVSESRDRIQGSVTAPVSLVEYGDYECPYCAQAYLVTLSLILLQILSKRYLMLQLFKNKETLAWVRN
jgi:protein-disulfide isomerase